MASAVFNGRLAASNYAELLGSAASIDLRFLSKLEPLSLREELLGVVSSAIQVFPSSSIISHPTILLNDVCSRSGLCVHHALL